MRQESPKTFYHAISQKRIQHAINRRRLPGFTRSMFIPEEKRPGIWLSDDFAYVFEHRHGEEYSSDVTKNTKSRRSPIILVLEGIDETSITQHTLSDKQFFYEGDLEWGKVKGVYVSKEDIEAVETAREMVKKLKAKGVEVEITEFSESSFRESLRAKPQKDNRLETEDRIIKPIFNKFKEGGEGKY